MSDPKLAEAVLAQEWEADSSNLLVKDAEDDGIAAYFNRDAVDTERARQAALGHRALRLLVNGSAVWSSVEDADAVRAIREELRGGK